MFYHTFKNICFYQIIDKIYKTACSRKYVFTVCVFLLMFSSACISVLFLKINTFVLILFVVYFHFFNLNFSEQYVL